MIQKSSVVSPLSLLLFAGIALLPVYTFASGGMQPAHLLLALFSVIVLVQYGFRIENWALLLLTLTCHVFLVEAVFGIVQGGEARGTINAAFFFYTFLLTSAAAFYTEKVGLKPFYFGVLIAALIAMLNVVVSGVNLRDISETGRATGTFNNPNQLGFFSVCLLSSTYFLFVAKRISYALTVCLIGAALVMSILSLSKAAMIANGIVLFFALKPRLTKTTLLFWLLGIFIIGFVLFQLYHAGVFDEYLFIQRLQRISTESDSSLASRGYFVILDAPGHQIIFGMGSRNIRHAIGGEVHSTLGSALNNYGIVGLSLMLAVLANWTLKIYRHFGIVGAISIVGPSMLYGITHNGSRFAFFWILFATTIGYIHRVNKTSEAPPPATNNLIEFEETA